MKEKYKVKLLQPIQESLNYRFNDLDLLRTALTHSSYANENKLGLNKSNERLEFLGDAILNLIVSQYLYNKYPDYPEGELTKIRAKVVCEPSLAYAGRKINLGDFLLLGKGEETTGGRRRESILADAVEAIVGAIYMDSDLRTTNNLLVKMFEKDIVSAVAQGDLFIDYKTQLQEKFQRDKKSRIVYTVAREEGPDHNKVFYIEVRVDGKTIGIGRGRNKKEAEQMAAKEALTSTGYLDE